jgi:4-oxalocrotonate tautomerase
MPFVHVELYPGRTTEQKTECARAITEAIHKHLNAPPSATHIVFTDVAKEDWFTGDKIPPPK